jgi:hypothetical protein
MVGRKEFEEMVKARVESVMIGDAGRLLFGSICDCTIPDWDAFFKSWGIESEDEQCSIKIRALGELAKYIKP